MATDKSQHMDVFGKQELGWVVPRVLTPGQTTSPTGSDSKLEHAPHRLGRAGRHAVHAHRPGRRTTARRTSRKLPRRADHRSRRRSTPRARPAARLVVAVRATTSAARRPAATTSTSSCPSSRHVPAGTPVTVTLQVLLGHRVGLRLRLRDDRPPTAARRYTSLPRRTATRRPDASTRTTTPARRSTATASPARAARTRPAPQADRSPLGGAYPERRVPRRTSTTSPRSPASATRAALLVLHRPRPRPARLVHRRPQGHGRRPRDLRDGLRDDGDPTTRASSTAAARRTCSVAADRAPTAGSTSNAAGRLACRPRLLPGDARPLGLRLRRARIRTTATPIGVLPGHAPDLHRRGPRLRQRRRTRRPAGPDPARLAAAAGQRDAEPGRRRVHGDGGRPQLLRRATRWLGRQLRRRREHLRRRALAPGLRLPHVRRPLAHRRRRRAGVRAGEPDR